MTPRTLTRPLWALISLACAASSLLSAAPTARSPPVAALRAADIVIDAEIVGESSAATATVESAKARLLDAIAGTRRGFQSTPDQRGAVMAAIGDLTREGVRGGAVQGSWTLAWTNAPDILNLAGPPWAALGRIGQDIDATRIVNVIEWVPSPFATALGADASDAVEQRVVLEYEKVDAAVKLKLKGLGVRPRQILSRKFDETKKPIDLVGSAALPFGDFEILFNDGDLRVVKTAQGYYSVNVKRYDSRDAPP